MTYTVKRRIFYKEPSNDMPQTDVISPFLKGRNLSFHYIRKGQMTFVGFVVEGSFKNRCTISLLWVECEGRKIHNLTGNY